MHTSKKLEASGEKPKAGSLGWIDRLQYDQKNKIAYGYFNDDTSLVVRVMASEKSTINKIFAAGFTIHIDTTGKKNPQYSINYPLAQGMKNMRPPGRENNSALQSPSQSGIQENMDKRLQTSLNSIALIGFSKKALDNAILNSRTGEGITAWIKIDSSATMYYELKVPLDELFTSTNKSDKIISIGLESGKIDLPSQAGPTGNRGMEPIGNGGRPGGGRPPGGGGQHGRDGTVQPQQIQALSQAIKIWIKRIELL